MNRHLLTLILALCCAGSPSGYSEDFRTKSGSSSVATLRASPRQVASDFNGDGKSDVLWHEKDTGDVYRQLMNGMSVVSGTFVYREPDLHWSIVTMGDFNGDGVTDLIWRHASGQVYYMPFGSNGLPTDGGAFIYLEPDPAWLIVHAPDLDGDGRSDLLW